MTRPVLLITLGALAGMVGAGFGVGFVRLDDMPSLARLRLFATVSAPNPAAPPAPMISNDEGAFLFCLRQAGGDPERALRDLIAFHDHEATLALTECLLDFKPQRFCPPDGGAKAADAMEIYLWSRDAARIGSPPHGLADKIRLLDRAAQTGEAADPFALSWSSPRDRALFDKLRQLAEEGYLDLGAFGYSGRAELRTALDGVKPIGAPCAGVARN